MGGLWCSLDPICGDCSRRGPCGGRRLGPLCLGLMLLGAMGGRLGRRLLAAPFGPCEGLIAGLFLLCRLIRLYRFTARS